MTQEQLELKILRIIADNGPNNLDFVKIGFLVAEAHPDLDFKEFAKAFKGCLDKGYITNDNVKETPLN